MTSRDRSIVGSQNTIRMVGTTGFEPATSRTPSVRATRLRHVPTAFEGKSRLSFAFEQGQDRDHLFAQIQQEFALRF
jgi:hypothetical protein